MILRSLALISILLWSLSGFSQYSLSPDSAALAQKAGWLKATRLTPSEVSELLKKISEDPTIRSIQALAEGQRIKILIETVKINQKLSIAGNQALTESEIKSIMGLDDSENIGIENLQNQIPKLKEKYSSMGMKNVEINAQSKEFSDYTEFILEINEGKTALIEDIIILSSDTFLNSSLKYALGSFKNILIDRNTIKNIEVETTNLLISHRLLGAKIAKISPIYNQNRTQAKITITIESPNKYEFIFDGNTYFSSGNIITHFDLDKNYLNYIKNSNLFIKDIEAMYKSHGFADVKVTYQSINYENQKKISLLFTIKEGPQLRIKNFNISGKITRPPSFYEALILQNLDDLNSPHIFIKDNVDKAIAKVAVQLKDEGYLKAESLPLNYKINTDSTVSIFVQINENMLTQIRSIQFTGLKNFTPNHLYDVIELKPNSTLSLVKVYESYNKLRTFYQKNGYLEFQILTPPEDLVRFIDNYAFADIKFTVQEGPQVIIKNIVVRGNTFTKEKVVLREIDLEPGMVLTSDLINDSIIFLERTQLFARAQIQTSDSNSDVRERTIFIDIQEKNPGLFSSGIGLSNERGITLRGNTGLSYQNLYGTGRGLSARGEVRYSLDPDVQYPENRVVLGYYEPYLFHNRLRARLSLVREQQIIDTDPNSDDVTVQTNNEFNFLTEKQINRRLRLLWNTLSLSSITTFSKNRDDRKNSVQIATIGPGFEWDRRDDPFVPASGTFTSMQVEYSHPSFGSTSDALNHIEFARATLGHTLYSPLTNNKRWVLVNDFRWGYLENLSDAPQSGVPFNKLFYLGGRSTLRGFDLRRNERVPSLLEVCSKTGLACDGIDDFKVATASNFYLVKTEIRFPIKKEIGGSIFYDGGAVFIKGIDIKDHYRDTAGFGLRYITPIGAFSAELGFKLDRKSYTPNLYEDERPYTFHISIGSY